MIGMMYNADSGVLCNVMMTGVGYIRRDCAVYVDFSFVLLTCEDTDPKKSQLNP